VRCERAKELLYRSEKPVKQVAAATGFRNEQSLIRAFRVWTGKTPAEFREAQPD
jgi:transcriptional regulator GlxA family with amidase domain